MNVDRSQSQSGEARNSSMEKWGESSGERTMYRMSCRGTNSVTHDTLGGAFMHFSPQWQVNILLTACLTAIQLLSASCLFVHYNHNPHTSPQF